MMKTSKKQRKMRNWRFNMVAAFAKNWKKYNHCLITLNRCNLNDEFIHKRTTSQIHQINNKMNQKIQQKNWTKLSLYSVSGVYKVCITNKLKTEAKKNGLKFDWKKLHSTQFDSIGFDWIGQSSAARNGSRRNVHS